MRCAIIATPALLPDLRPAPGALDGDLLRTRLPQPDTGFTVVDLDPGRDLAEQLDVLFDADPPWARAPILFYASSRVALAIDSELFVCLDPADPKTGDSLRDLAEVLRERAKGPLLFVLECRHEPDPANPFRSAAVVEAAKDAIARGSGIELLVAAHPLSAGNEDVPSPFTRAFVEALDDADPDKGLSAKGLYEQIRDSGKLVGAVPSFAYVRGRTAFQVIDGQPAPIAEGPDASSAAEQEPPQAPAEEAAASAPAEPTSPTSPASEATPIEPEPASELVPISIMPESIAPLSVPIVFEATGSINVVLDMTGPVDPSALETTGSVPISFESSQPVSVNLETTGPIAAQATFSDHIASGDKLAAAADPEGALREYKNALGLLSPDATKYRAEIFIRIAQIKAQQDKRREAISHYEKAVAAQPTHRKAIDALLDLAFTERDWKGLLAAEERLFSLLKDDDERFSLLVSYAERWGGVAFDADRARALLEQARDLRPADTTILRKLHRLYEALELIDEAIAMRKKLAELADEPREQAREYLEIGRYCLDEIKREPLGFELLDTALDSDPTFLEPLDIIERLLEERQEWSELEHVYRRMIERLELAPKGQARTAVTWDICRRLAFLYRDHLEDQAAALSAFEDALEQKPDDIDSRHVAAELARSTGNLERAASHLQALVPLDPTTASTYHELFEVFQKLKRPDQAYGVACVTMHLKIADSRERFMFEEHLPDGMPKFAKALREGSWQLLRIDDTDVHVEAILAAVARSAVQAKLDQLEDEKRLPQLDPTVKQDPQTSTVSIVRSFAWGSHYLGVPAPAVYIRDDAPIGLAAVMASEPSVIIGSLVLRGRSMPELGFLVGRHLAYHLGSHRLLLYYPSLEDLSICFLAALRIALKNLPIPPKMRDAVMAISPRIEANMTEPEVKQLEQVVAQLDASGKPADITRWVSAVEHCAARAGLVLSGDLDIAVQTLQDDPLGMVPPEEKIAGLFGFAVSDAFHSLRQELGVAIEP
jgi:tetratricopeptide (TPR) repeat protein